MTQTRRRASFINRDIIEITDEHVQVGGTADHEMAVRDQSSQGINNIKLLLATYPGENDFGWHAELSEEARRIAGPDDGALDNSHGHGQYPSGPDAFVNANAAYPPEAIQAVQEFKDKKTFKTPLTERLEAMKVMITALSGVYAVQCPDVEADERAMDPAHRNDQGTSGASSYSSGEHKIRMSGKLSIITLLHEFGHAMGGDEYAACDFSFNLFAAVWPDLAAQMNFTGHMATR